MSFHGSFVTQYIDCKDCFNKLKELLLSKYEDKFFVPVTIENKMASGGSLYPVISGKIADAGDVAGIFLYQIASDIRRVICCRVVIVVIDDTSSVHRFIFEPNKEVKHNVMELFQEAEA